MRVSRERQIFLALCALDEAVDHAREVPVRPNFALRFVLAFLWSCSDGRDRDNYNALWRNIVGSNTCTTSQNLRHAYARSQLNGVVKSLRFDVEIMQRRINKMREKPGEQRPAARLWGSMTHEDKRENARRARQCDIDRIDQPFPKGQL